MKWLAAYGRHLLGLLTSVEHYHQALRVRSWVYLAFFVLTYLWLGWLGGLQLRAQVMPLIREQLAQLSQQAITNYPADLQIDWDGRQLHVNRDQLDVPYPFAFSNPDNQIPPLMAQFRNQPTTAAELQTQTPASWLVITPTEVLVFSQPDWNHLALTELPGMEHAFSLTQSNVVTLAPQLAANTYSLLRRLSWAVVAAAPLGLMVLRGWTILLDSLLIWLLLKLYGVKAPFVGVVQLGLCIGITAQLISQLAGLLYPDMTLPLFAISFWVIATYALMTFKVAKLK